MKKAIAFILIFFLFFSINFNMAYAQTRCRHYIDGVCQNDYEYIPEEVTEPIEPIKETNPYPEPPKFVLMLFQLIGIIVLLVLLIIIFQELVKSKSSKVHRRNK